MGYPQRVGREFKRHSTFIEDGRRIFAALVKMPGAPKVKTGRVSGRRSKAKAITIYWDRTCALVTLGNATGHQVFRVFCPVEELAPELENKFPEYSISIRGSSGAQT